MGEHHKRNHTDWVHTGGLDVNPGLAATAAHNKEMVPAPACMNFQKQALLRGRKIGTRLI
jgi:hypothetical protein